MFVVGAFIVTADPAARRPGEPVLGRSPGDGATPLLLLLVTVLNGIAEELFFRGALYAAIPRHQVPITTVAYTDRDRSPPAT